MDPVNTGKYGNLMVTLLRYVYSGHKETLTDMGKKYNGIVDRGSSILKQEKACK